MLNKQFKFLILSVLFTLNVLGAGTYIKGPALIEGFTTITSAAGTTTLTVASETKQIVTGATTQTIVLPDATTLPLGRKFLIINKSSGDVTVNDGSGALLVTVVGGTQAEVHLRVAGGVAGTWDVLESSAGGGGGTWGSITGTLSDQTDLQTVLDAKADENNPSFAGTIGTTITASRLLVTDASSNLAASTTTATEAGYLSGVTGGIQTQLDAKQLRSTLTTKGDLYVATASATTARQGVGSDGQILAADSTKTNGIKWIDPVNADNLIFDGDAEAGITNFVEGSYSAATRPSGTFTASSGAGTFEISTSSSSPIFGANSFLLTKSSGASRQGRAIERTINIDSGYQTKMLKTRIDYTIVSGTFVAGSNGSSPTDSSLIWYVGQYNGSTWTYHEPSTFKMFSNSTTNKDWVEGEFQVNADTTQLKLIGFISESANSAWVVKAEVGFRLSTFLAGTTITDWVSYTPTVSNLGTGSTSSNVAKWRRVGDSAEYMITFQKDGSNGSGASVVTWGLASGQSIDATKLPYGSATAKADNIGSAWVVVGGNYSANNYFPLANSATTFAISQPTTSGQLTGADIPAGTYIIFRATVPISGWSSSTQVSDWYDGRQIGFRANNSSTSISGTPAKVVWTNTDKDDVAGYSSGTYTIKSPGWYDVDAALYLAGTPSIDQTAIIYIYRNGASVKDYTHRYKVAAATTTSISIHDTYYFLAGDTVEIYAMSEATSPSISSSTTKNVFSLSKRQSPTTISATEKLVASYGDSSGQSITGSNQIIGFNTLTEDTHAIKSGTGTSTQFIMPEYGTYRIFTQLQTSATTSSGNQYFIPKIYIDGSPVAEGGNRFPTSHISPTGTVEWTGPLNAGQIVTIRLDTDVAASRSLSSSAAFNRMSIIRIK